MRINLLKFAGIRVGLFRSRLGFAVELVLVVLALTAAVGVWADSLGYYTLPINRTPEFKTGQRVPGLLPPSDGRGSLVLFLDTQCSACVDSKEIYAHLLSAPDLPAHVRIGVISHESVAATRTYLRGLARRPDFVISIARGSLRARTPSLLLISQDDRILQQWFKPLTKDAFARISDRLRQLRRSTEVTR